MSLCSIFFGGGILGSDFGRNICVILTNLSSSRVGFNTGDRITQMLFQKNEDTDFVKVSNCEDYVTERGIGGFGSTGS